MDIKEINKRITALHKRNASIVVEVQTLGLACLDQVDKHSNTTPLNSLVAALTRSQVQAFAQWAMAYGKVRKNNKEKMQAGQFFAFASERSTDMEGAVTKCWDEFAPVASESVVKAFDFQGAVLRVLKKAAEAGEPQSMIDAAAKALGIDAAKVPKTAIAETPALV